MCGGHTRGNQYRNVVNLHQGEGQDMRAARVSRDDTHTHPRHVIIIIYEQRRKLKVKDSRNEASLIVFPRRVKEYNIK